MLVIKELILTSGKCIDIFITQVNTHIPALLSNQKDACYLLQKAVIWCLRQLTSIVNLFLTLELEWESKNSIKLSTHLGIWVLFTRWRCLWWPFSGTTSTQVNHSILHTFHTLYHLFKR